MIGYYADWAWKGRRSIELLLVLPGSLRLLAALHAGTLIMLSLANLGDHASLGAAALKPLERAVDGLAVLDMDLRHLYFPPSEVSGSIQDTLRAIAILWL